MSSLNNINVDLSKLSVKQREMLGKLAFADREASLTPFLLLTWLDVFFLGIVYVVFAMWFTQARSTEKRANCFLVYWLITMATAFSATYQGYVMYWFGHYFGSYHPFFDATWMRVNVPLGALIRIPTLMFYLHRAYTLTGGQVWPLLLVGPMLLYMIAVPITFAVRVKMMPYDELMRQLLAGASSCEVAADILLTSTIAYRLWRSRTGWHNTDKLIRKLLFTLAETQTPPTIIALAVLIVFYQLPNSTAQLVVVFHPKIGVICLLFTLLSRVALAEMRQKQGSNALPKTFQSKGTTTSAASSMGAIYFEQDTGKLEHGLGGATKP